jgi:hypothetical protein
MASTSASAADVAAAAAASVQLLKWPKNFDKLLPEEAKEQWTEKFDDFSRARHKYNDSKQEENLKACNQLCAAAKVWLREQGFDPDIAFAKHMARLGSAKKQLQRVNFHVAKISELTSGAVADLSAAEKALPKAGAKRKEASASAGSSSAPPAARRKKTPAAPPPSESGSGSSSSSDSGSGSDSDSADAAPPELEPPPAAAAEEEDHSFEEHPEFIKLNDALEDALLDNEKLRKRIEQLEDENANLKSDINFFQDSDSE